jgi:hypothetical protein
MPEQRDTSENAEFRILVIGLRDNHHAPSLNERTQRLVASFRNGLGKRIHSARVQTVTAKVIAVGA